MTGIPVRTKEDVQLEKKAWLKGQKKEGQNPTEINLTETGVTDYKFN